MSQDLDKIFAAGDQWLMKYGVVTPIMHNNIILVLYAQFPQIKYLEYMLYPPAEERRIQLTLHLSTWRCLFTNTKKLASNVVQTLEEYLYDYQIDIQIKRYKPHSTKSVDA